MRRRLALCVVAVLLVVASTATGAAATTPAQPTTTTEANRTQSDARGERIDGTLALVSSSYDGDGTATLTFAVDEPTAVTLSDAGDFVDGGRIHRETFVLDEGTHTVTFDVTESERGYVGVSIATQEVLYAEVLRSPSLSPFSGASGTLGWFGGATILGLMGVLAGLYKVKNEGGEPVEASP